MEPGNPRIPAQDLPAHLELLRRQGRPVAVVTDSGLELTATILTVDAAKGRLSLEIPDLPPRALLPGASARIALPLEGHRWEAPSRVLERQARTFLLSLPGAAEHRDRRSAPRIPVPSEAGLRAHVHLGPQGPLLSGPLLDLSSGGFRFQVERAIELATRERMDAQHLVLEPGQPLDAVELTGLRESAMEAGGLIRDLDPGPILHVQFRALLRSDRAFLQAWSEERHRPAAAPLAPEPLPEEPPVLLWMEPSPAREGLAALLEGVGEGPVICVDTLPDLRRALQTTRHRAALLLGPTEELASAVVLVRALRGGRPCPILSAFPGAPGCDQVLSSPLKSAELLSVLASLR